MQPFQFFPAREEEEGEARKKKQDTLKATRFPISLSVISNLCPTLHLITAEKPHSLTCTLLHLSRSRPGSTPRQENWNWLDPESVHNPELNLPMTNFAVDLPLPKGNPTVLKPLLARHI